MTQTVVLPAQNLSVSVLTNATDGAPAALMDGVLHILHAFAKHGPAAKPLADWTGRWWFLWSAVDLVPMGERVVVAVPGQPNPFADASELSVTGPDTARISKAGGFGSHGETAQLVRNRQGKIVSVALAGAKLLSEAAAAKEVRARYASG